MPLPNSSESQNYFTKGGDTSSPSQTPFPTERRGGACLRRALSLSCAADALPRNARPAQAHNKHQHRHHHRCHQSQRSSSHHNPPPPMQHALKNQSQEPSPAGATRRFIGSRLDQPPASALLQSQQRPSNASSALKHQPHRNYTASMQHHVAPQMSHRQYQPRLPNEQPRIISSSKQRKQPQQQCTSATQPHSIINGRQPLNTRVPYGPV